ncbi:MAG TPA: polysaccharide deacetylase family protein [Solirubrobacteraceae bacterium]|nr:polysaccharide deacetylase family protein [Solirubrobacteraceae bacterium]
MRTGPASVLAPAHHAVAAIHAPSAHRLGIATTLPRAAAAGAVTITFDDGPHPEGTPQILALLAAHQVRATFFVVGEQVQRRPELVRRIVQEGHLVALHAHRHQLQLRRSARDLSDDYTRGMAAIEEAINRTPTLHRPPYGIYSRAGLHQARQRGLQPLLWSAWGKDWRKFTTPERIAARVIGDLHPRGTIVLLHDADFYSARHSHLRTAQALKHILTHLESSKTGTVLPV